MAEAESAIMEEMQGVVTTMNNDQTRKSLIERVKKFYGNQRKQLVPWSEFLKRPKLPANAGEATKRIMHNVPKFKANYILISCFLALYALCTSPLLLLIMGAMYAGLTWSNHLKEEGSITVMGAWLLLNASSSGVSRSFIGREIDAKQVAMASTVGGGVLLWLFGATSVIFWMLGKGHMPGLSRQSTYTVAFSGASIVVVGGHAALVNVPATEQLESSA
jgi:FtsH-binding integral membrane protein